MKYLINLFLILFIHSTDSQAQFSDALLKKAESGSVTAQIELAKSYIDGNGGGQSEEQALTWYEKAAEQNNIEAMIECGKLLCDASSYYDLKPDYVKGFYWYQKAASKGSAKAKEILAGYKFFKEEVSHDCPFDWLPCDEDFDKISILKENKNLISKEYENKSPIAAYYLAVISYVDKDFSKAVGCLEEAYPLVMDENNYYEDFLNSQEDNIPIGETIRTKVFSLLGWCYEHGQGVKKDYTKAAEYYLSEFDYWNYGLPGIPKVRGAYCLKKAGLYDKFIQEADSQGIEVSFANTPTIKYKVPCLQLELAEMYKTGEYLTKNLRKALDIYESIVDMRKDVLENTLGTWRPEVRSFPDIGKAAYRASQMYRKGDGCKVDEEMADLYFEIALKYGDNNAWYEYQSKK